MTDIADIVPVSFRQTTHTIIVKDAAGREHVICKDRPDWAKVRAETERTGDGQPE